MALTLQDLVATPELKLELHTSGPDAARAVTWVHVSELLDPTPFLTGGELLLTTGLAFGADTAGAPDGGPPGYVERLRAAGVVGLGFGTGLSHSEVPAELLVAARRWGLSVIEVPRQTPFIAISRAVSNAIAADEYAAVTRTFAAQQALTRAALAPSGPGEVVRLLAQQVGGWVALMDGSAAPLASHPPISPDQSAALAAEVIKLRGHRGAVSSAFPVGDDTVSVQPVGSGRRRTFLAVGRPGALSAADRHLVNAAVLLLTIRLEQSAGDVRALAGLRSAMVRLLLAGDVELVRPIATEIGEQLPDPPLAVLAVLAGPDRPIPMAPDGPAAGHSPAWLAADVEGTLVVIAGESDPGLRGLLAALERSPGTSVGVAASLDYPGLASAHRQALQAARFARRTGGQAISFRDISAPGVTGLIEPAAGRAFAESLLAGLIEHDRIGRGDLLASLRVWLAHHGQWDPAATELGIHRHTLRNRMNTAEDILGRSLDSPGTRSELWLALQLIDSGR